MAAAPHIYSFAQELRGTGGYQAAVREGRLVFYDAEVTLARLLLAGEPEWFRFDAVVGTAVRQIAARTGGAGLRAYGEMVGLLWKAGRFAAAERLEEFWNRLLADHAFSLFCAYPIDICGAEFRTDSVEAILRAHTHFLPSEHGFEPALRRALGEVLGPAEHAIGRVHRGRPDAWPALPEVEGLVLEIRHRFPDHADEVLSRARAYWRDDDARGRHGFRSPNFFPLDLG